MDFKNKPEILDRLLSWSEEIKKYVSKSRNKVRVNISNFITVILF